MHGVMLVLLLQPQLLVVAYLLIGGYSQKLELILCVWLA
jgi:hypothetical protein